MDQEQNRHVAYSPLDQDKREFRLVRILDDSEGIKCRMRTFSLHCPPDYCALSYCWTDKAPTCKIELDGKPFSTRPNLQDFLQRMYGERQFDWFFVDALCINQNDMEERSSQVGLMGDVYRSAHEVFIWLGKEYHYPHILAENRQLVGVADYEKLALDSRLSLRDLILANSPLPPKQRDLLIGAIVSECLGSDYWSRLWIVQEVLLAKRLRLWCKHFALDWEDFTIAFQTWSLSRGISDYRTSDFFTTALAAAPDEHSLPSRLFSNKISTVWAIIRQRDTFSAQFQAQQVLPLSNFLAYAQARCSLVHDKVFGLYGVSQRHISIDYSMPVLELYLRYMTETLRACEKSAREDSSRATYWFSDIAGRTGLARSFGLDPTDTVIILVVSFTAWVHEAQFGILCSVTSIISFYINASAWLINLPIEPGVVYFLSKPYSWLSRKMRSKMLLNRIQSYRNDNSTISIINESMEARTYKQWLDWMSTIMLDVYTRMQLEDNKPAVAAAVRAFS